MEITRRSFSLAALAAATTVVAGIVPAANAEETTETDSVIVSPAGSVEAAAELLDALQGTYVELFPTINQYTDIWMHYATECVGEEMAEDVVAMLQNSMVSEMTAEEAVAYFAEHTDEFAFNCFFPMGAKTISIEGSAVTGYDEAGEIVFSGEYEYLCYNPNFDFYVFKATDPEAAFQYFLPRSDNMADTFHLEFRLGNDLNEAFDFYTGESAYCMPAAIAADADEATIEACIELFVTENLS